MNEDNFDLDNLAMEQDEKAREMEYEAGLLKHDELRASRRGKQSELLEHQKVTLVRNDLAISRTKYGAKVTLVIDTSDEPKEHSDDTITVSLRGTPNSDGATYFNFASSEEAIHFFDCIRKCTSVYCVD